jgi:hypothetical protein
MGVSSTFICLLLVCIHAGAASIAGAAEFTPRYRNLWAVGNPVNRAPLTLEATDKELPADFSIALWGSLRERSLESPILYDWIQGDSGLVDVRAQLVKLLKVGLIVLPDEEVNAMWVDLPTRNLIEYALRVEETSKPKSPKSVWPLVVCEFEWGHTPPQTELLGSNMEMGYRLFASLRTRGGPPAASDGVLRIDTRLEMFGGVYDVPLDSLVDEDKQAITTFPLVYTPVFVLRGEISPIVVINNLMDLNKWLAQQK